MLTRNQLFVSMEKMKIYMLAVFLPCIWATEVLTIQCPDGNFCPIGETCCEKTGHYECCDITGPDKYNKKLVPSTATPYAQNVSYAVCPGTLCSKEWCCEYEKASCCSGHSCCPYNYKCCRTDPKSQYAWCCKSKDRCSTTYLYCIAGARAVAPYLSVIAIFVVALTIKHF